MSCEMASMRINRRDVLAAAGISALAAAGVRQRVSAQATPEVTPLASGVQPDGTWAFTDDRGVTVTLPSAPRRIIADVNAAAPLWDYGVRPHGVFGWNIDGERSFNSAGGAVDPNAVEFLNDPGTTLDVERAAAAAPELIVSLVFAEQYGVWSIDPAIQERVEQIAPIVAISGIVRADRSMERFAELAAALGADLNTPEVVEQRAAFDSEVARLEEALAAKPGLSASFVWASPEQIYVASPDAAGDIMLFRDLGLTVPALPVPEGEYWELLSTEQALKYPTDLLFYSLRSELAGLEDFQAHPTMSQHPGVLASQVFGWNQDFVLSYTGIAASLAAISDAVDASTDVTGS